MALTEDGVAAINHELNGTRWPLDARQAVIDLFERIAELEAEVERLRILLEAARPKRPVYERHEGWKGGPGPDIWMTGKEVTDAE